MCFAKSIDRNVFSDVEDNLEMNSEYREDDTADDDRMAIPLAVISNFYLEFLSKSTILFEILQTKIMIFGNTVNITYRFSVK